MEPLAAIGLASNILQFVEFTHKLVSTTHRLYQHGSRLEFLELESIAQGLRDRARAVTDGSRRIQSTEGANSEDQPLERLAADCIRITDELLAALDSLRCREPGNKWGSFYQALKTIWKADDIKALQDRVDRIGNALSHHLVITGQRAISEKLNRLTTENHRLEASRADEIRALKAELSSALLDLQQASHQHESLEAPMSLLLSVAEKEARYSFELSILSQLRFSGMDDRYETVSRAHKETFKWVFGTPGNTSVPLSSVSGWLASDRDVFWVSGKPGSGKSTLMKYISMHDRTKAALQTWAGGERVITASFFFWSAAKRHLQKSHEGLLRSLLYQILRQSPETIEHIYPEIARPQHHVLGGEAGTQRFQPLAIVPETVPGLLSMLRKACEGLASTGQRCCFFIDGLDEYEGRPIDMVELIRTLRTMPLVKLCIASRPWNEFEQSFGQDGCLKLYMQDLTRDDIRNYVNSVFQADKYYQALEKMEGNAGAELVNEIIEAAQGVFLWVILVVRSFQEGLMNGDRIVDLQARLRLLPRDLNEYFEKILLADVDEFYRPQAALMFAATLDACHQLPLMAYWFLQYEKPISNRQRELQPMTLEQMELRLDQTRKRLNACCKGLLEEHGPSDVSASDPRAYFEIQVDFLHRTVKDFLATPQTRAFLSSWNPAAFPSDASICYALLDLIKQTPVDEPCCRTTVKSHKSELPLSSYMEWLIPTFMNHCKTLNDTPDFKSDRLKAILNYFDETLNVMDSGCLLGHQYLETYFSYHCQGIFTSPWSSGKKLHSPIFLDLCARYGLHHYVVRKYEESKTSTSYRGPTYSGNRLLHMAVEGRHSLLVRHLIEREFQDRDVKHQGAGNRHSGERNPSDKPAVMNEKLIIWGDSLTVWTFFLATLYLDSTERTERLEPKVLRILRILLENGADLGATFPVVKELRGRLAHEVLRSILENHPEDLAALQQFLPQTQPKDDVEKGGWRRRISRTFEGLRRRRRPESIG
ncbi:hypothetical protein VTJ49DRAFT_4778 [Mycothermus thermophilus]|uniref:NACHT domain-containing protein n=1 Tax=Humicola insolens TaxID=85995 RepID=A0ABR3VN56_HUMIN